LARDASIYGQFARIHSTTASIGGEHVEPERRELVLDARRELSLADIGYLPYVDYLFAASEGEMIGSRPHVDAWWKRISERPSWKTARASV
jgi:hypothetical protein